MFNTATRRLIFALAATFLPATLIAAVPPNSAETPGRVSLMGQLLVATPTMRDPRFEHSVILMLRHDRSGAFGIVINRPVGERKLADLLAALGDKDPAVS